MLASYFERQPLGLLHYGLLLERVLARGRVCDNPPVGACDVGAPGDNLRGELLYRPPQLPPGRFVAILSLFA
jgi:hypothetical protein